MVGRWERLGTPFVVWFLTPAVVFGFGYYLIGPVLSADSDSGAKGSSQPAVQATEQPPIEPGVRKWTPVTPPQVNISVRPKEQEEEPTFDAVPDIIPDNEPPVEIPETTSGDEAGVGGMTAPPVKREENTGGTTGGEAGTTTGGAFKGIGG